MPGAQDAGGLDEDDDNDFCVPGADSTLVQINGCFSGDEDWDGQSYRNDWPGTNPNPFLDRLLHPSPVLFTSPLANGRTNYSTIAFETDLPAHRGRRRAGQPAVLRPDDRRELRQPAQRRAVLPVLHHRGPRTGTCTWQQGGKFIPGTINHFGGSSTTEFGPLLQTVYPAAGFTTVRCFNNFNSGDRRNPCPVG